MELGLRGKLAVVTGGSHGIGLAIAKALAKEGCDLIICSRSLDRLQSAELEIAKFGTRVVTRQVDVLKPIEVEQFIDFVNKEFGTLHILINNVGGGGRWGTDSIEETPLQVWSEVYEKNAGVAVRCIVGLLDLLRRQKWGRVITIGSIYGKEGGGRPWFNMAKAAEISLMKSLALRKDLVRDGITFNTVVPGSVMIKNTGWDEKQQTDPRAFSEFLADLPMGRLGSADEVASMVAFLCSEQAGWVNGAAIVVDGGESKSF